MVMPHNERVGPGFDSVRDDGNFIRPFDTDEMHFAQAFVPLEVTDLFPQAVEPE
jgi:hypothetical protein